MTTDPRRPASKAISKKATTPASVAQVDKTRHLEILAVPGKSDHRILADLVTDGLASNASTAIRFIKPEQGDVSLTDLVASLRDHGGAVNRGDLAAAERMLLAQAVALNAVFSEMARRAALNMGEHLNATESYMRLALKAQSQSRATVETLAAIKNPPVVFARQANISNGPQQINNGAGPTSPSRAENAQSKPNELLGASDVQWLDTRTPSTAGGADSDMAALATVNRAADDGGKSSRGAERIQGRAQSRNAGPDTSSR